MQRHRNIDNARVLLRPGYNVATATNKFSSPRWPRPEMDERTIDAAAAAALIAMLRQHVADQ